MEIGIIKELSQFGFAAIVAGVMILIMYKLARYAIEKFESITSQHSTELKEMHKEHREEREKCYKQNKDISDKFDETIKMFIKKIDG